MISLFETGHKLAEQNSEGNVEITLNGIAITTLYKYVTSLNNNISELQDKIIKLETKEECLHCGKDAASYCEKCYQDLIGTNAKLQQNQCTHNIGNECIRKSKIKEKIEKIDEDIEYQKMYGNITNRERLEFTKRIYLDLLEDDI